MPLRDLAGRFSIRAAEAAPVPVEAIEVESEPLSPAEALRRAQFAWQAHQQQLAALRNAITTVVETRRAALAAEDWGQAAELDSQLTILRTRLEGAEIRDRGLGEAVLSAQAQIGRPEAEALRLELARAVEALCGSAHTLVASIEKVRALQLQAGEPNPVIDPQWVNGYMIGKWAEYHRRKVHAEAA